jgi:hypothetical protein
MRVLVLCGGPSKPFEGWGNPVKHLLEVEGEVLLHRTVRMAREYSPDVHVISPRDDTRYKVEGAARHDEKLDHPMPTVTHMFWPSRHLWNLSGRTVLLLGDVWFSEAAMRTIMSDTHEWAVFGRAEGSRFTGCKYGEIWAFVFDYTEHDTLDLAIAKAAMPRSLYGGGTVTGWEVLAAMGGQPFIEINDFTEDFDSPRDLRRWKEARDAHIDGDLSSA